MEHKNSLKLDNRAVTPLEKNSFNMTFKTFSVRQLLNGRRETVPSRCSLHAWLHAGRNWNRKYHCEQWYFWYVEKVQLKTSMKQASTSPYFVHISPNIINRFSRQNVAGSNIRSELHAKLRNFYSRRNSLLFRRLYMPWSCPSVRPSVCLSVCPPSHSGVLSRRMKLRSCGFHRQVGQSS